MPSLHELTSHAERAAADQPLFTRKTWDDIGSSLKLSPRELEISTCLLNEEHEQTIADGLNISAHTVHTHVWRLYRKLKVNSRVGLVVRIFAEYLSLNSTSNVHD